MNFRPMIPMGFWATWKDDLQAVRKQADLQAAEMLYGTPIRLPGVFFIPSRHHIGPSTFVDQLETTMENRSPTQPCRHGKRPYFISKGQNLLSDKNLLRTDKFRSSKRTTSPDVLKI